MFHLEIVLFFLGVNKFNGTNIFNGIELNNQLVINQKNFGGYGGLLLKGNDPVNNYPNIAFSVKNTLAEDAVAALIQGDLQNNASGAEAIDLTFLTSNTGLGGLGEKMRIKNNGNIGIGTNTPNAPLQFASTLASRKMVLYESSNNDNQFYGLGVNYSGIQTGLTAAYCYGGRIKRRRTGKNPNGKRLT